MPIHHFASLFRSTIISNNLSPKVRVEYSCGSVEYTTACSTGGILLQVGPSLYDIDGEYRGGGVVEEVEENEGEGASIE